MALKVFGGLKFKGGKQRRTIVATNSQKAAAEAVGLSLAELRSYWSVTGNANEVAAAMADPGVVLMETEPNSGVFQKVKE